MQTTLLGIAVALILALVTALVGPIFVNWNAHRAFFEAEASRLVGLPVHVIGAIDVRVLPIPSMTLRGIAIGEAGDASRLRAGALAIELGLGPLMRGELRAVEMRLIGPEFKIGIDRSGTLDVPNLAIGIGNDRLSIEHLTVEEGRAIFTDETTGYRLVLEKLYFRGEVRSLAGPFRGEGGFLGSDSFYKYRISTSRFGNGELKLKLALDGLDRSLVAEAEGALSFDYGAPRFDGNIMVARPAGAMLASGKAVVNEPWRTTTKIKASPTGVMFDQVEFQYGPDERALKLAGTAEAKFGEQPHLEGKFSGRHIDFDRLIASPDTMRRLPFAAVKTFAELFADSLKPVLPTRLAISFDTVTLAGATLQAVSGDLSSQGDAWNLDKFEFRAPGFTQVRAAGRLELTAKGLGYTGLANINAADSMTLLAWLTGRSNLTPGTLKPWLAHGMVTLARDRIAVEQLRTEFDRASVDGRFVYAAASRDRAASLKAELNASEIDIDAWLQVADTVFAGLSLDRPRDLDLGLEINKARIGGFEARKASINLKLDKDLLDLKRLTVEGLGEATLEASGRIDTQAPPRGNIKFDLDARDLAGVVALAEKFLPSAVEPLRRLSGRQPGAKLRAVVSLESSGSSTKRTTARIAVDGQVGILRVNVIGGASSETASFSFADLSALAYSDVRFEAQVDSEDGAALLTLIGLDRVLVTEKKPGRLKIVATGPLQRDFRVDVRLTAGPIDINASGGAKLFGDQSANTNFHQFYGTIGGSKIQGELVVAFGSPLRIDGSIEAERIDAPAALASLLGVSVEKIKVGEGNRETWSLEPFTPSAATLTGRIEIKAARVLLSPKLIAQSVRGVLQVGAPKVAIEVLDGELAGGKLTGDIAFFSGPDGMSALSYIELNGARTARVIQTDGQPPITGRFSLQTTIEGLGLTPAAFMGSLRGNGAITIEDAEFAGLNPNVFEALTRAVDLGIQADTKQIKEFVGIMLDKGYLPVRRAQSNFTIVGGQLRLVEPRVEADGAELAVAASVDLAAATCDATLTLSGPPAGDVAGRPAVSLIIKGGLTAPRNAINSDSLAGWLTLRSVERQSKRLETIEATRRAALSQPQSDIPSLGFSGAAPALRNGDDDDVNTRSLPSANSDSTNSTESTSGIVGSNQIPPLLPPIMIQPEFKLPDGPGASARKQH